MDNEQILKEAIEKAVGRGYEIPRKAPSEKLWQELDEETKDTAVVLYLILGTADAILFSHSFAEAFWPDVRGPHPTSYFSSWEYHLQQMVLEKDRCKYLAKFL